MTPAGPSRLWYVAALAVFALSLLPAALLGRHAVSALDVDIVPLDGPSVATGPEERAVWVDAAASTSAADVSCDLRRGGGDGVFITEVESGSTKLTLSDQGRSWQRVGVLSADDLTGWRLTCRDDSGRLASTELALSINPELRSFAVNLVLAFVIPLVAAVMAAIVAIAVALRRRRAWQHMPDEAGSYLPPPPAY